MKHRIGTASLVALAACVTLWGCSPSDLGITAKVKAKMAADTKVQAGEIEVDTVDGVVTLKGNIDSEEAKERALTLARETTGVVSVTDLIAVRRPSGTGDAPEPDRTIGETIDDAGITIRVKERLVGDVLARSSRVDVDTREGVVYLTGTVGSRDERDRAIKRARETRGVKDVQANLEIGKG